MQEVYPTGTDRETRASYFPQIEGARARSTIAHRRTEIESDEKREPQRRAARERLLFAVADFSAHTTLFAPLLPPTLA
jgi:hypothetical protein